MQNTSRVIKALVGQLILAIFFSANVQACEKPVISNNLSLVEMSESGFKLEWGAVSDAQQYTLKYILRIPEGRTLIQKDAITSRPFFYFSKSELPHEPLLHLVVEVVAQCTDQASAAAIGQIALTNADAGCRFETPGPIWTNGNVSWRPVKAAQSYLMCQYMDRGRTQCRESFDVDNKIALQGVRLIAVTPVCNKAMGTTAYVPEDTDKAGTKR